MSKEVFQKNFKVISNQKIRGNYFEITLDAPGIALKAKPGQFVMLRPSSKTYQPLLRRPLSIHSVKKDKIKILYEVLGQGTQILSEKKPAEFLDLIGPLGNGFNLTPNSYNLTSILVAGGIGVAPLVFLAQKLKGHKTLVLIGAKTKTHILCEKEFKELGCSVKIATEDGSRGFHGRVTDLLEKHLTPNTYNPTPIIYACGPEAMFKAICNITSKSRIKAFGSFQAHMACGIGACMGCAIKTKDENITDTSFIYKSVCKDGPVFTLNQIIWGEGLKDGG
jgi:dihydroorotate dehydrogenase electron transfer subunit